MRQKLTLLGLTASPYHLKMQALADYAELTWERLPDQAGLLRAVRFMLRLQRARKNKTIQRYPKRVEGLDEYPAVPFYSFDGKQIFYDSSGLAQHLDALRLSRLPLLPDDPPINFLCRLIDEAFDEFGLYMVHHNRWVTSASTNVMAETTLREMRSLVIPPMRKGMQRNLSIRQVSRCPYLFSVAPAGYDCGMPPERTPPARAGFPETHSLLNSAWRRYLAAMESILTEQPFLLGERFTLADASAYGQLAMNLPDGRAAELLQEYAPRTYRWLCGIANGEHATSEGELSINAALGPLLSCVMETFVPLMQQNEAAFIKLRAEGIEQFNEAAFDRGEALYDGELMRQPFRAVAKTFQVATWRELSAHWHALPDAARATLSSRIPGLTTIVFSDIPANQFA
ncbi:MAG: glutathione S-transferase C-terminal domain-containing protein [Pseudomonadota bacterium]